MGRTNMLDFFLRKGIGLTMFKQYTLGVLRKSKFEQGSPMAGYLGLLTMLSKRSVFSLAYVISLINNLKVPLQSWYHTILLSVPLEQVYPVLHSYYVRTKILSLIPYNEEGRPMNKRERLMNKKEV